MVGSSLTLLSPPYGPTFHFNGLSIRVIIVPLGGVPSSRELDVRGALMKTRIKWLLPAFFAALLLAALQPAQAAGVTDTEIRIGNIMPYTGPLAAFGSIGRAEAAYFDMINARGGINGRQIKFISRD